MRFFAIADLHLSNANPKPMDIFGGNWQGHPEIIFERWQATIQEDDVVLIPGDISWAMTLNDALLDLNDIDAVPGTKVILRGNHDYWWSSVSKVRSHLPKSIYALQNDALLLGDTVIAGARGWSCPGSYDFKENDHKLYNREANRLKLSLEAAKQYDKEKLIVMMHYPPANPKLEPSLFTDILLEAKPDIVVFGHIHGESQAMSLPDLGATKVHFVAADALEFYPKQIL